MTSNCEVQNAFNWRTLSMAHDQRRQRSARHLEPPMNRTMLKATLIALSTTVIASAAMAQETTRGNGTRTGGKPPVVGTAPTPPPTPKVVTAPVTPLPLGDVYGRGRGHTYGIDRTQATQDAMIARGQRNGSLTSSETAQLRAEQARIADLERRAKSDGVVTREERNSIRQAQQQADAHIWQESHDRERTGQRHGNRGWYRGWW
jgi:hypothetical protein